MFTFWIFRWVLDCFEGIKVRGQLKSEENSENVWFGRGWFGHHNKLPLSPWTGWDVYPYLPLFFYILISLTLGAKCCFKDIFLFFKTSEGGNKPYCINEEKMEMNTWTWYGELTALNVIFDWNSPNYWFKSHFTYNFATLKKITQRVQISTLLVGFNQK